MLKLNKFVVRIAKNKRDDTLPGPVAVPGMYNNNNVDYFISVNLTISYTLKHCPAHGTPWSRLMFVNVNGPDISNFDPLPFVRSWLADGGRLSTSHKPGATSKSAEVNRLVYNWVM